MLSFICFVFAAPLHIIDPGNSSLYAKVRKKNSEEGAQFPPTITSPPYSDRAPSASSDSGLSVASQGPTRARQKRGAVQDKRAQAEKFLPGVDIELALPLLEVMSELGVAGGGEEEMTEDESGLGHTINGEISSIERETDILDDDDDDVATSALDMPSSSSMCSLSSDNLPEVQKSARIEYSTHSWVQQQIADVPTESCITVNGQGRMNKTRKEKPPPLVSPDTPPRGHSSKEAVQRGLDCTDSVTQNTTHTSQTPSCQEEEEEMASLATDIDESIEQLNQLILDLDPTFVPVPTRCAPLSRSASIQTNGISHKGNAHMTGKTCQNKYIGLKLSNTED